MEAPAAGKGTALRQYYVAVSSIDNKLATLLDLLRAFEAAAPLSLAAVCGSRDSLDGLVAAAAAVPHCRVWVLHSDLSEREVEAAVRDYRAAAQPEQQLAQQGDGAQQQQQQQLEEEEQAAPRQLGPAAGQASPAAPFVAVLATTDAALRALPKELLPLSPTLLVSFDLPTRKESYVRRISSVLGSRSSAGGQRISVYFAVAGQLEELRQVEEFSEKPIEEMPVHVSDIFT